MKSVTFEEARKLVLQDYGLRFVCQFESAELTGDTPGLKNGPRSGNFFFGPDDTGRHFVWVWHLLTISSQDMPQDIDNRRVEIQNVFRDSLGVVHTKKTAGTVL